MTFQTEEDIVASLKKQGFSNVESNCGTIWYDDDDGNTYAISEMECERSNDDNH